MAAIPKPNTPIVGGTAELKAAVRGNFYARINSNILLLK